MEKNTLYEKDSIRITCIEDSETDHELWIKSKEKGWNKYHLEEGRLKKLAHYAEVSGLTLMCKLDKINLEITNHSINEVVSLGDFENAFIGAYDQGIINFERYLIHQQRSHQG